MLKLIIVDDELWIREGLKRTVDWQARGIRLAGEAENGREALELLKAERPDIVITDIRMPAMDGTELMEEAKRSGIGAKIILISGFGDFEYAQKALKLGAFDYILKPIEEETLLGIVDRCAAEIRQERMLTARLETLSDLARTSVPLARQKHLELCLTRQMAERELQPAWQALGIDLCPDRLTVLSVVVHDWGDRDLTADGCALMRYAAGKLLEELLAEQGVRAFACPRNEDDFSDAVVIASAEAEIADDSAVRVALKQAVEQAQRMLGIRMSAGMSGTVGQKQLLFAFQEALSNCANYFVDGGGRVYGAEAESHRPEAADHSDIGGGYRDVANGADRPGSGEWQSEITDRTSAEGRHPEGADCMDGEDRCSKGAYRDVVGRHLDGVNRSGSGTQQPEGAERTNTGGWQLEGAERTNTGGWQLEGAERTNTGGWHPEGADRTNAAGWPLEGADRTGAGSPRPDSMDRSGTGSNRPEGTDRAGAGIRQPDGSSAFFGGMPFADKPPLAAVEEEDARQQPAGEHTRSTAKAELLDTALTNRMVHAMLLSDESRLAELLDEQEALLACWVKRSSALAVRGELNLFVDLLLAKRREHLKPAEIPHQAKLRLYRCPLGEWKRTVLAVFAADCPDASACGLSQRRAVDKALRFIHENYQHGISLADVAETIYLNPSYFSRMFHDEIGEPLSKYLIRIRIAKAKELLGQTPLKIYEIADLVGYNDFRHFVRTFKEWEGITPTQFRNYGA